MSKKLAYEGYHFIFVIGVPFGIPKNHKKLPGGSNGILQDQFVWRQQDHAMNNCLADEHSVKWVLVVGWKPGQMEGGLLFQWEGIDTVLLAPGWNEPLRRFGEGQPSQGMFDGDFSGRNRAQINLIGWINKENASRFRKLGGIRDDPKKSAGIQQYFHRALPWKAETTSGGKGS
jgi:hypothetical protein